MIVVIDGFINTHVVVAAIGGTLFLFLSLVVFFYIDTVVIVRNIARAVAIGVFVFLHVNVLVAFLNAVCCS